METRSEVIADVSIGLGELALLLEAAGYRERAGHLAAALVERGLAAYIFVAHTRDAEGRLAGYVGAVRDGTAGAEFVGTLAVHPLARAHGVGDALVRVVERRCAHTPLRVRSTRAARRSEAAHHACWAGSHSSRSSP